LTGVDTVSASEFGEARGDYCSERLDPTRPTQLDLKSKGRPFTKIAFLEQRRVLAWAPSSDNGDRSDPAAIRVSEQEKRPESLRCYNWSASTTTVDGIRFLFRA